MTCPDLSALFESWENERIPRDPEGCLRCDGRLRGAIMFCDYCQKDLEDKHENG